MTSARFNAIYELGITGRLRTALVLFGRSLVLLGLLLSIGCTEDPAPSGEFDLTWGQFGSGDGKFRKPRSIVASTQDELFVVDKTGRVQVFDLNGEFLRKWWMPEYKNGKPCGLSFDRDGNLLVADTHYYRVLTYRPSGELLEEKTIGGVRGAGQGEFGFVTDAVQDSRGYYYVSEYGDNDRIQRFSPDGEYDMQWGGHGETEGLFNRPQCLAVDKHDRIWVADSCNHRIQVFEIPDKEATLVLSFGTQGKEEGQLSFPWGILIDDKRDAVYVCEFGSHRIQRFSFEGEFEQAIGGPGRREGQLCQPWSITMDRQGRIHIVDTYNHRVQRIRL